jgi:hypothetical protein
MGRLWNAAGLSLAIAVTGTSAAYSQGVAFYKLDLASDLRFTAGHCFALKIDLDGMKSFLRYRGVPMDVFDPNSLEATYINARDREHEDDLKGVGTVPFCRRYYAKFAETGLFRKLSPPELRELNAMRRSSGGDDIQPLD